MPRPNPYPISGIKDPHLQRVLQDMTDRQSFLEREVERLGGSIPSGMAKRESPVEGLVTIPYRDHGGRDGSVRISKDGVVVSYTNPVESVFPYVDLRLVNSSGVGPDVLHTFTLPANSLDIDGAYLDVWYAGSFSSGNDRNKAVQAQFDGTSYENGGVGDIDAGFGWVLASRIIRKSATSVSTSHLLLENALAVDSPGTGVTTFGGGMFIITRNSGGFTVANLNTTAIVMRVRSVVEAGAAAADVFQNQSIIKLYRPRVVKLV